MISFIVAIIVILLGNFIFILFLCIAKIIVFCKKKSILNYFMITLQNLIPIQLSSL